MSDELTTPTFTENDDLTADLARRCINRLVDNEDDAQLIMQALGLDHAGGGAA